MNPSEALAAVLIDEFVRGGVREVVLCPGSRSAPLAYAVLEAERVGRLRLHVRVDERSAGFLALGLATGSARPGQRSGAPVVVITTSGTAVANLHPAVLEAHHAGVPLVVLSADRPHELRGTGANQTTTQPGLFGHATRFDVDLPAPDRRPRQQGAWRSTVCRALAAASGTSGPGPGPVHLNVALREPLVPEAPQVAERHDGAANRDAPAQGDAGDADEPGGTPVPQAHRAPTTPERAEVWPESLDGRPGRAPWVEVRPAPGRPRGLQHADADQPGGGYGAANHGAADHAAADHTAAGRAVADRGAVPEMAVSRVERTLVVVGDGVDTDAAVGWAARRGYPCVAEPFGSLGARAEALPHGPLLLTATDWLDAHLPERVLVVGRPTLARPVAALLRRPGVRVEVVTDGAWADPAHVAATVYPWAAIGTEGAAVGTDGAAVGTDGAVVGTEGAVVGTDGAVVGTDGAAISTDGAARAPSTPSTPGADAANGAWSESWMAAGQRVADAVAVHGFPWPSGLAVAEVVARLVPDGAALVLGSSNPVRDLDLAVGRRLASDRRSRSHADAGHSHADAGYGRADAGYGRADAGHGHADASHTDGRERHRAGPRAAEVPDDGVRVFANRGLAGIDGVVSTAVGVGLAHARPTYLLLGDLTFLHDANGLLIGPAEPRADLTIIVVNDDGGGIFTTLEPGAPARAAAFERLFGTPTGTDLGALCRAHGIRHDLAVSREQLAALLAEQPHGIRVVEVPVDRASHRATHEALRDLAARALAVR
ncbi:MAG: 2-succinyl-5-enolpyruvyl-6-hydroxy-3-cyclohexene-1-carboxylic-acid synthase [Dermatophilaceae bacterium]